MYVHIIVYSQILLVCVTVKNTENRSFLPRYHPQHLSHPHQIPYAIENNHHLYSSSDWVTFFFLKKKNPPSQNVDRIPVWKKKPFHINFSSQISLKMDILDLIYLNNVNSAHWAQYTIAYWRWFFLLNNMNKTVTDIRQRCISFHYVFIFVQRK